MTDDLRRSRGLLTVADVAALDAAVLDPGSLIVSAGVRVGTGCLFYPSVVIECDPDSVCEIGSGVVFWPGTVIIAAGGGAVRIGDGCVLGPGGAQIKAAGSVVELRPGCRLLNGAEVMAPASFGPGCQVIGAVSVRDVVLAGGGDFTHPDPDERGAVLKGSGTARGLRLDRGDVVNGFGDFAAFPVERQVTYHPRRS